MILLMLFVFPVLFRVKIVKMTWCHLLWWWKVLRLWNEPHPINLSTGPETNVKDVCPLSMKSVNGTEKAVFMVHCVMLQNLIRNTQNSFKVSERWRRQWFPEEHSVHLEEYYSERHLFSLHDWDPRSEGQFHPEGHMQLLLLRMAQGPRDHHPWISTAPSGHAQRASFPWPPITYWKTIQKDRVPDWGPFMRLVAPWATPSHFHTCLMAIAMHTLCTSTVPKTGDKALWATAMKA